MRPLALLPLLLLAGACGAAEDALKQPEARAGPFRVVIDRVAQGKNTSLSFRTQPGQKDDGGAQSRRTVQLQIEVLTAERAAAAGLASFQVHTLTAETGRRVVSLAHYGGMLDSADSRAVVRAYLYVPGCPPEAREIRSLEGEIVAYDGAGDTEIEIPAAAGALPRVIEKDGLKATLRTLNVQGRDVQVALEVEGPPNVTLINSVNDGTYGVSVLGRDGRAAAPAGGSMTQPRPNFMSFRLGFLSLRGEAGSVRVRLGFRGGSRRVYPFRIDHIPIPARTVGKPG